MRSITINVENAVKYHDPDDRSPARILAAAADTFPVPVPSETSIPEVADDLVLLQIVDETGKKLLALPIMNYLIGRGQIDDKTLWRMHVHVRENVIPYVSETTD